MPVGLFLAIAIGFVAGLTAQGVDAPAAPQRPPNIVLIVADDLGYGDLACYGNPTIRTPRLDAMAAAGMRFTQFYAPAPQCTPSRVGLLTGRLAIRSGMTKTITAESTTGLPNAETTLAEALKAKGYATACVGKWHLGHDPRRLPLRHGFDEFFGVPYSNDYNRQDAAPRGFAAFEHPQNRYWQIPLIEGDKTIEAATDQRVLTERFTTRAIEFIESSKERPFFLYLAHTAPHAPLFVSRPFKGKSVRGRYGDSVEEIDQSTGRILDALASAGLATNTLVLFTSDNGPWIELGAQGGSPGPFRGGKSTILEGGMRVPLIASWPGRIPKGEVSAALSSGLDFFPTCLALAGAAAPAETVLDGFDLTPVLMKNEASKRQAIFYYDNDALGAIRVADKKVHLIADLKVAGNYRRVALDPPALYHLHSDPRESRDVSRREPGSSVWFGATRRRHQQSIDRERRRWAARFRGERTRMPRKR